MTICRFAVIGICVHIVLADAIPKISGPHPSGPGSRFLLQRLGRRGGMFPSDYNGGGWGCGMGSGMDGSEYGHDYYGHDYTSGYSMPATYYPPHMDGSGYGHFDYTTGYSMPATYPMATTYYPPQMDGSGYGHFDYTNGYSMPATYPMPTTYYPPHMDGSGYGHFDYTNGYSMAKAHYPPHMDGIGYGHDYTGYSMPASYYPPHGSGYGHFDYTHHDYHDYEMNFRVTVDQSDSATTIGLAKNGSDNGITITAEAIEGTAMPRNDNDTVKSE